MEKYRRIMGVGLLFSLILLNMGCDEVLECVFNIEPEIHDRPLELGILGERYRDRITAEISNEVNDDDYIYTFTVFGDIPPGIGFDIERRSIVFFGVPEEVGTYRFEVELSVESYDLEGYDGSPTCSDQTVREFRIQVVD